MKRSVSWNRVSHAHRCPAHHGCQRLSSKSLALRGKSPVFTSNAETTTLPNRIPREPFQDAFCSPAQSGGLL